MDNRLTCIKLITFGMTTLLVVAALLAVPQSLAQQEPKLSAPFAQAAMESLLSIESDDSIPQDRNFDTWESIDATDELAVSAQEVSFTNLLREIYQMRLQDNRLMRAYGKLIEIENAQDASEELATKRRKDSAVSQFADAEEAIMKRQEGCFRQLEESLGDRSTEEATACTEWIQKTKTSEKFLAKSIR